MPKQLAETQTKLESVERQLETAKIEVEKPFAQEAELAEKLDRLSALNALLNMDEKGDALGHSVHNHRFYPFLSLFVVILSKC